MNVFSNRLSIAAVIFVLTLIQTQVLWTMHENPEIFRVSEDIVRGHAPWKVYQNRILGPYAVHAMARLPHMTVMRAYKLFALLVLLISNGVAFHVGKKMLGNGRGAWSLALCNMLAFLFFADSRWLYPWDFIDSVIMLLAAYFIWSGAPVWWFVGLFGIELLNREAAMFIALWLVLDAGMNIVRSRTWRHDLGKLATGLALIAVGAAWTQMLRSRLLKWNPPDGQSQRLVLGGQHFHLSENIYTLAHPSLPDSLKVWILLLVFACALLGALYRGGSRALPLSLLVLSMVASSFLIAFLSEMRIWISIVPFLLPLVVDPGRSPRKLRPEKESSPPGNSASYLL